MNNPKPSPVITRGRKPCNDPSSVRAYLTHRRAVLERSLGLICAACGDQTGPFCFDHIDPATKRRASHRESRQGRLGEYYRLWREGGLQLLCDPCNVAKGCRFVDYRPRGHMDRGLEELREAEERWLEEHVDKIVKEVEIAWEKRDKEWAQGVCASVLTPCDVVMGEPF